MLSIVEEDFPRNLKNLKESLTRPLQGGHYVICSIRHVKGGGVGPNRNRRRGKKEFFMESL